MFTVHMRKLLGFLSFVAALVFGVIAMFTPPMAVIDSSVLWFIAQMLLFTASLIGIDLKIMPLNKDVFKTGSHNESGEDL